MSETIAVVSTPAGIDQHARGCLFDHQRQDKTANYTLLAGESGKAFSNKGATGAITLTLPLTFSAGTYYWVFKLAAQNLTVKANTGATINNSASAGTYADTTNGDNGLAWVCVFSPDGTNWMVDSVGTWATT